jgi:hypothetical protein
MAVPFILGPQEHHPGAKSPADYRAVHQRFIAKKARFGARYVVHEDATPVVARLEGGTWLADCLCGNGCVTSPALGFACCFGCGAVLISIQFPMRTMIEEIEEIVLQRPRAFNRNWLPHETVDQLKAENLARGLPVERRR